MVVSARDLVFGGTGKNEDVEGKVHFTQKGPASAIAYASFRDPKGGTLLYFQNLTSLNEYFAITRAEPVGIVAGEWPETGMALPAGSEPLPAKKEVTVSDAFLCFSGRTLANETAVRRSTVWSVSRAFTNSCRDRRRYTSTGPMPRRGRFTPWINRGVALNELAVGVT
jgi:hypothetical protein